jgi:catalase
MVNVLTQVDKGLADEVGGKLNITPQRPVQPINHSFGADTKPASVQPVKMKPPVPTSEPLSMANTVKDTIKSRKIAFLVADGVDGKQLKAMKSSLVAKGATVKIVAPVHMQVPDDAGQPVPVDETFLTAASVLFDAVYVPGGQNSVDALKAEADAIQFVNEAFKHCKAIGAEGEGSQLIAATFAGDAVGEDPAVVVGKSIAKAFIAAIAQHRNWERELKGKVPA